MSMKGKKIVLGITGSIAAYKAAILIRGLIKKGAEVQVVITPAGKKSEGNTKIQQNPYKKESMAWAAWIIARLGAWSAYKSQSIPGYITFKNGLDRFYTQFELYELIS